MPTSLRSRRHVALIAVLIEARKQAGFTQRQMATKMRVSQTFVASIESGLRRVDVVEFMDWARALDRDPVELFARVARP
jgi:transcriptional regulator with XRE-family HTH domain